jgi:hypothetical protein
MEVSGRLISGEAARSTHCGPHSRSVIEPRLLHRPARSVVAIPTELAQHDK